MSSETYKSSFEGTFSILRPSDFVKENAAMKGSVFMVDGTDILGVMIDEYGEIWTVNIDDSTVRFKTVFVYYENGKPAVAEHIYSRSGDEGNVPPTRYRLWERRIPLTDTTFPKTGHSLSSPTTIR